MASKDADNVRQSLAAAHFNAVLQRAKKIKPFKKYVEKEKKRKGSLFDSLKEAIKGAASRKV